MARHGRPQALVLGPRRLVGSRELTPAAARGVTMPLPAPGSSALRAGRLAHAHTTPYQWSGLAETGRGGRCGRANERRARGAGAYGERRARGRWSRPWFRAACGTGLSDWRRVMPPVPGFQRLRRGRWGCGKAPPPCARGNAAEGGVGASGN